VRYSNFSEAIGTARQIDESINDVERLRPSPPRFGLVKKALGTTHISD
jgi:hypothetical protein